MCSMEAVLHFLHIMKCLGRGPRVCCLTFFLMQNGRVGAEHLLHPWSQCLLSQVGGVSFPDQPGGFVQETLGRNFLMGFTFCGSVHRK